MLTEQTYLFNIFMLFFVIIIVGYKIKMDSKNREIKRSSTKYLVINNGETKDFPSKVVSYLEKHVTIEIKDVKVKDSHVEGLNVQVQDYHKTILICRMGDRMLLYQEQLIKDLDQQFQDTLQVVYLLNQGSLPYCVPECPAHQQVNIYMNETDDERFLEENFKGLIDVPCPEKWMNRMKFILFFLGLLWIRSIYGYLQSDSAVSKEEYEKLQANFYQISQNYADLLQDNKRLAEENIEIREIFQEKEQGYHEQIKLLKEEIILLNERLIHAQDEIQNLTHEKKELERRVRTLSDLLDQELEKNKALENENRELKVLMTESDRVLEQSEKKLTSQKNEFEQSILDIQNQREKVNKFMKEKAIDYSQKL